MNKSSLESAPLEPPFPHPEGKYLQCAQRHTSLASLFYRFRRTFDLAERPSTATLRITGCSQYAICVNGQFINRGPLVSGRQTMTVDQFDVAEHLRRGRNIVSVHLVYYPVGHFRLDVAGWQGAGFVADLIADDESLWTTDSQWKAEVDWAYEPNTSKRNDWMPLLEIFDARRDENWTSIDYNDSAWPNAVEAGLGVPGIEHYEARPAPVFEFEIDDQFTVESAGLVKFKSRVEDFYWFADHTCYESISESRPKTINRYLADTPLPLSHEAFTHVRLAAASYVLGRPTITLTAPAGTVVDFIWGERARDGDTLLDPTARMSNWARMICREGKQTFTFWSLLGFKQLQLIFHPAEAGNTATLHRIGAQRQWTMRCDQGEFESDNDRYTRLWQAGARTAACVTTDHHCDNTFREHQPWSGDQEWTKMGVYVSQGIHPTTERQLEQFALGQKTDGRLISPYPSAFPFMHTDKQGNLFEDLPDHAAGYIHSLWRHYQYSGNRKLLKHVWPALQKQTDYWHAHRGKNGLVDLGQLQNSWIWVDWTGLKDKTAPLNSIIGCAMWAMVQMAQVLGEDVAFYRNRWQTHRDAFIRAFWSDDECLFIDRPFHRSDLPENRSQHTNTFAACADLIPDHADTHRLARALVALDDSIGIASPPMSGWVFTALEKLGSDPLVHTLIERQWLIPQIIDEMGTVPEFWPETRGRVIRSWAQGGSPFISWALTHFVLGVRPAAPGYSQFTVQPTPGKLARCQGTVPTPHGPLHVQWHRNGSELTIKVDAPDGCRRIEGSKNHNDIQTHGVA